MFYVFQKKKKVFTLNLIMPKKIRKSNVSRNSLNKDIKVFLIYSHESGMDHMINVTNFT